MKSQLYKGTRVTIISRTAPYKNNKLGERGITLENGKYRVRIIHNKKSYSFGLYDSLSDAKVIRDAAIEQLYLPILEEYKKSLQK